MPFGADDMALVLKPPRAAPAAPEFREFTDIPATRKAIFDRVLAAAQEFPELSNQRYALSLADVKYTGPEDYSLAEQKKAIMSRDTLGRRLQGTWVLRDVATGQEIGRKRAVLAKVPYMTPRGTFIHNGVEYALANQLRLRPGVYVRRKLNDELEVHLNTKGGLGSRIFLDPETGVFRIQLGQARLPLLPVLQAMGAQRQQLQKLWGSDIVNYNYATEDPKALNKLYAKLVRNGKDTTPEGKMAAIAQAFQKMELDPEVTKRTLGRPHTSVTLDTLLDVTKKLLAVNRGEADTDDRDSMAFQVLYGPEDLMAERIQKAKAQIQQHLWRITNRGTLDAMPSGVLHDAVTSAIIGSGLGMPMEEIGPAEILDQVTRVTRMGEGGIPDVDAIPQESRSVQPTQFGFIDYLRTPERGKTGVDLRMARNAVKGRDGKVYTRVLDRKGNLVYKTPQELADAVVAFPGEKGDMVGALVGGKIRYVPRSKVDYTVPDMEGTMNYLGNLIPIKSAIKGQRATMVGRFLTQALPLEKPEAPFVQSGIPGNPDRSFEEEYGRFMGALHAEQAGRVLEVKPGGIRVKHADGSEKVYDLYDTFPLNRKTFLHQTPLVQPGDFVKPGQLLAKSNFTDDQGTTALGVNARVAYLPYWGKNYEDGIVISESMAKKLSSVHAYQHDLEFEPNHRPGKKAFIALFPSAYDRKTLDKFTDDGVIKPGTEVRYGDPLILAAKLRERTRKDIHRGRQPTAINETVTWEHHTPGVVTDVHTSPKGVTVVVKASVPAQVADKISARGADKGVITAIIPDDKMPVGADGKPFEVLLNPLGLPSRVNPQQLIEAALGKIVEKTGKPYKYVDFSDIEDAAEFARSELRKHGLSATEDLIDPETGRKIPRVMTGNRYFLKLHHTAESKLQGRGIGGYSVEGTPAKGGTSGSKRVGMMETHALLSAGAVEALRDAKLARGQANPQYWQLFMAGYKPPTPTVPFVYEKFVNQLMAAGIRPVRQGERTHIMAMTDRDIDELAGARELTGTPDGRGGRTLETVDWKDKLKERPGGLFDVKLTGGHGGKLWSYIKLEEPMPSPVFEDPIRRVLGLSQPEFREILAGKRELRGKTGPQAIQEALASIDLEKEIAKARQEIHSSKRTERDAAIRRLGYLKSAQRLGIHPKDWVLTKVPVLPPVFRPLALLGPKKLPYAADYNYLIKEVFDANDELRRARKMFSDVGEERLAVYDAFRGLTGLGDPIHPKNQERKVKGLLRGIFGDSPKRGVVQSRLLSSTTDLVGRGVIIPDPDLGLDEVGLPENRAWDIYKPFIVRHLVRKGMPRLAAVKAVEDQTPEARKALIAEMESRPVYVNRAPSLHKFNFLAMWPKLMKGDAVHMNPFIYGGYGADNDGDSVNFHVPSTDEAAQEAAERLLPSKNLFAVKNFRIQPKLVHEYVGGLYEATRRIDKLSRPAVFVTKEDAIRAYRRGEISPDRQVEILKP